MTIIGQMNKTTTGLSCARWRLALAVVITVVVGSLGASSSSGKVLLLAHYSGSSADADYAVGSALASGAGGYPVAGTTGPGEGKWGRALDQRTDGDGRCAYQATNNLDPLKGTADFWFVLDEYYPAVTVQPVFGWWNPPNLSAGGFYVHISGTYSYLAFNFRDPADDPAVHETLFEPTVGQWYHMEINWDCTGGDGDSTYNVYLDGQSIIRRTGWDALGAAGGEIRVGIWGFYEGYFLHGRVDELRITDQIEHLTNFTPPVQEYEIPGTTAGLAESYQLLLMDANSLEQDVNNLTRIMEITQWTKESCPAAIVQSDGSAAAQASTDSLQSVGGQLRQSYLIDSGLQDTLVGSLTVTAAPVDPPPPDPCNQGWLLDDVAPVYWTIDTPSPSPFESIDFSAPLVTQNFSPYISATLRGLRASSFRSSYWAGAFAGGIPMVTIDPDSKTIEISFELPAPDSGATACDPVSGLTGSFGPLERGGDWVLFCDEPGATFALPFHVSSAGCIDVWESGVGIASDLNHNCYVELGDVILLAAEWLRCNEPSDTDCEETPALTCGELWALEQGIHADLSQDCYVDAIDFSILADDWMRCNDPCDLACE